MHCSAMLAILLALLTALATAAAPGKTQHLIVTRTLADQTGHADLNNLYLVPFHTAAGYNVVTFSRNATSSPPAALNGSRLQFDFGAGQFPAYMRLDYPDSDFYAGWFSTNLDQVDRGSAGFRFTQAGTLTYGNGARSGFGGWRVCRWNHEEPELFHDIEGGFNKLVPRNCARVDLVRVPPSASP